METFAVLTRGMYDEMPFLPGFVRHYTSLGFQCVYYVETGQSSAYLDECLDDVDRMQLTVLQFSRARSNWQEEALRTALAAVREDWVLIVDIDEFLCLNCASIADYASDLGSQVGAIRFGWRMALSDSYAPGALDEIAAEGISLSRQYKSMARVALVQDCNLHNVSLRGCYRQYEPAGSDKACLLHFASRGLYDVMGRIVDRDYESEKSGRDQEARLRHLFEATDSDAASLPFRLNLFRLELTFEREPLAPGMQVPALGVPIRSDFVRGIFLEKAERIGVTLPRDLGAGLDDYLETRFRIRERLLRDLPSKDYSRRHLLERRSYANLTLDYVRNLGHARMAAER